MRCSAKYKKHLKLNGYDLDGWVCNSCSEQYYNPIKAERILLLGKLKKMRFHLKLSKVKSNLIIRIPKEIGDALDLRKGEKVELGLKDDNTIEFKAAK